MTEQETLGWRLVASGSNEAATTQKERRSTPLAAKPHLRKSTVVAHWLVAATFNRSFSNNHINAWTTEEINY